MADSQQILSDLSESIGEASIKIDPEILAEYAVDDVKPRAVVFPKNTHEVSEVVKYANQKDLAIIPWGSGTKMSIGNPPKRLDLVLSTSRMNHMTDVDTANLTLTVEAGVKFRDIQARLATEEDRCYLPLEDLITEADEFICSDREHKGAFLPLDPPFSDKATIGGIIASNSCGPRRLLYTNPRDVIIGVRFVSPTGEIVGMGGKTVKNVSGYDISKLMVGSMGTLGILCDMTLRLLPLPERMETLLVDFDTFSGVSAFIDRIFESQLLPAAVEVMNQGAFAGLDQNSIPDFGTGGYVVTIALEGFNEAVARMNREMREMAAACGAKDDTTIPEDKHGSFWLRAGNLAPVMAEKFSGLISLHLNYQISKWKEILEFAENTLSADNIGHTILTPAGIGICKMNLLVDGNDAAAMDKAVEATGRLLTCCRDAGGNMAVHRAPVEVKQHLHIWGEAGPDFILIKRVKEQLDPSGIMCPGRFVEGL